MNIILLTVALLMASMVNAATITWEDYTITGDVSEVLTQGTMVDAANVTSTEQKAANPTLTFAGTTFTSRDGLLNLNWNNDQWSPAVVDADYDKFLSYLDYSGFQGDGSFFTLRTFTGLTVGWKYIVQVWYAAPLPPATTRTMTLEGAAATTDSNILEAGEYGIGTFTADATTQTLRMKSSESGLRCTGFQLREIFGGSKFSFQ